MEKGTNCTAQHASGLSSFPGGMERDRFGWHVFLPTPTMCNLIAGLGIVENVRDGTWLRIRLLLPDGDHQMVNISLAGVKSPRVAIKSGEASEPLGEEVGSIVAMGCKCPFRSLINGTLSRRNFSLSPVFCNVRCAFKYYHYPPLPRLHSNPAQVLHLCPQVFSSEQVSKTSVLSHKQ